MHFTKKHFEIRLQEFFERHDPEKIDLAHIIAERYHLHQDEVFEHLTKHYDKSVYHEPSTFKEKLIEILTA
jgi:thioredoxin-like negative regulator of GroEL